MGIFGLVVVGVAIKKTTYIDGEFGIGVVVGQWCPTPTPSFRGILRMNDGAKKE